MTDSLVRQILDLQNKTPEELRKIYDSLFPQKSRVNAGVSSLRPKIAYRLQELQLGGLSDSTKSHLFKLANKSGSVGSKKYSELLPGTRLCREYNNVLHEVVVLNDGFIWRGQKFKSLSAIAREITGTRWNGHRFFHLRRS